MKSNIMKILFLLSLYIKSSPIQNRLLRLYLERKPSFSRINNLLIAAKKIKKQRDLLLVINHSNLLSDHDKKKLAAKVWYSLGLPKRSWNELRTLPDVSEDILKLKALVLFELRDVTSFLELFEAVNHDHLFLSNDQAEAFMQYGVLKCKPAKAIRLANLLNKTVGPLETDENDLNIKNSEEHFNGCIHIEDKTVREISELVNQGLQNDTKLTALNIVHTTMRKLEGSPQKYEELLPKVFEWNEAHTLNLPLNDSSWGDLIQIHELLNKQDYLDALQLANSSYLKGERSELLKQYYYKCLENVDLTKRDLHVLKRVIDEGLIELFTDRMIIALVKNYSLSTLFHYLPLELYNLDSFKSDLKKILDLPLECRNAISEILINEINQAQSIRLIDNDVLAILGESVKQNDKLDLLKTKHLIDTSQVELVEENVKRFTTEKSLDLLLDLSTYSFDKSKFDLSLLITENAYKLSPWNIRVLRRLVTIHHRIGNITKKLAFLEKLNVLTLNLLKKDILIARDEAYLLNHRWDWNTHLPKPKLGNKVIHVLNKSLPEINGYTIRSKEIVHHQKKLGYEPVVVTKLGWPLSKNSRKDQVEQIDGVSYHRLYDRKQDIRLNVVPLSTYFTAYASSFAEFLIKSEPKLVHAASNFQNALPAIMAAKKLGVPTVYEVRGLWQDTTASKIPQFDRSERYNLHEEYELYCCELADKVVVIGVSLAEQLISLGVDKDKISIVPNGVDVDEFKPQPPNEVLMDQYDLKGRTVFGFIGSVTEYEGLDLLLKAISKLKSENDRISFILVGDGPALKSLKDLARQLDLLDIVHFVGRIPHTEVKEYYSVIDAFPFPRKNAKVCALVTPLKPFEVMGMGKLAMVSNIPALNEMVRHEQTGLIFEAENVESLYNCLLKVNEYKHVGMDSRKWVEKERAWNLLIRRYVDVYESLKK